MMTQAVISKTRAVLTSVLVLCALTLMLVMVNLAQSISDDLGRLSQVIDGPGNVAPSSS
jgi:hypothetical protein